MELDPTLVKSLVGMVMRELKDKPALAHEWSLSWPSGAVPC